jgi:hypothetical protein
LVVPLSPLVLLLLLLLLSCLQEIANGMLQEQSPKQLYKVVRHLLVKYYSDCWHC